MPARFPCTETNEPLSDDQLHHHSQPKAVASIHPNLDYRLATTGIVRSDAVLAIEIVAEHSSGRTIAARMLLAQLLRGAEAARGFRFWRWLSGKGRCRPAGL